VLRFEGNRDLRSCDGLTRRDFLRVGGVAVGLSLAELTQLEALGAAPRNGDRACIQLLLVGGPGQLDTWDPKPDAPEEIRGPFRPIATSVPGIAVCEHFPLLARRADRVAIVRSVYHREAPIHETGQQLLQTGRLARGDVEWPHAGAVLSKLRPTHGPLPPWMVVPGPLGDTGVSVSHGQSAGYLGAAHGPILLPVNDPGSLDGLDPARLNRRTALVEAVDAVQRHLETSDTPELPDHAALFGSEAKRALDLATEPEAVRTRYGWNTFGQSCLLARRLVEHGVRLVTVNMFDTVFGNITWDSHAAGGDLASTLDDYRSTLCPMFDTAYAALLDNLEASGLLEHTLVLAAGEFGRTPKLNARGGRDHWPGVWSVLLSGGGVRGGHVIGASDRHGAEPKERPVHAAEIAATVYHALGIDPQTRLPGPDGRLLPVVEAEPLVELF
jgi:uncharacterized protein (DUF1501 family)